MNLIAMFLLSLVEAAQPELVGSELRYLGTANELERDITAVEGSAWVSYAVPAVAGAHRACNGVFDLERGGGYTASDDNNDTGQEIFVFVRVDAGDIIEVRSVTSGCRVRAAGAPVYFLSGVAADESVRFLTRVAGRDPRKDVAEDAVHAIAWHDGEPADDQLDELVGDDWPSEIREKAVFWMGAARGERGYASLEALVDSVSEQDLKEKIVFALHVSDAEGATSTLIRIAREDPSSEVREKALFWLGQEAGERASDAIVAAVLDDPDIEVKKKAVFALSQLPPDDGVPLLVEVAETHPSPEIRKKAFFWLGQSGDPRALELIEKVLSN